MAAGADADTVTLAVRVPRSVRRAVEDEAHRQATTAGRLAHEAVCALVGADPGPRRGAVPAAVANLALVRLADRQGVTAADVARAEGVNEQVARSWLHRAHAAGLLSFRRAATSGRPRVYRATALGRRMAGTE